MKIQAIPNNALPTSQNSVAFKAGLKTTRLFEAYRDAVDGSYIYGQQMREVAQRIRNKGRLDEDVIVSMTKDAQDALNRGVRPTEPAAEVCLGHILSEDLIAATSRVVKFDVSNQLSVPAKILEIAEQLFTRRF